MAWSVGEILDTLRQLGKEKETLAVFVSDHGPHREICLYGGETGHFRGALFRQVSLFFSNFHNLKFNYMVLKQKHCTL